MKKNGSQLEDDVQSGRLLDQDLDGRHEGSSLCEAAAWKGHEEFGVTVQWQWSLAITSNHH